MDLEREKGIEPSPLAWEASVLPLNYSRLSLCWNQDSIAIELEARCRGQRERSVGKSRIAGARLTRPLEPGGGRG